MAWAPIRRADLPDVGAKFGDCCHAVRLPRAQQLLYRNRNGLIVHDPQRDAVAIQICAQRGESFIPRGVIALQCRFPYGEVGYRNRRLMLTAELAAARLQAERFELLIDGADFDVFDVMQFIAQRCRTRQSCLQRWPGG